MDTSAFDIKVEQVNNKLDKLYDKMYSGDGGLGGGGGGGGDVVTGMSPERQKKFMRYVAAAIYYDKEYTWGNDKTRKTRLTNIFGEKGQIAIQNYINKLINEGKYDALAMKVGKETALQYTYTEMKKRVRNGENLAFDTGGYTGVWGPDGRWALLHQKELVLNAEDTENILSTVNAVRDIVDTINVHASNAGLITQYALASQILSPIGQSQQVEQNVHITAEFPNVQDHNEIEMAVASLVNRASQFAWQN